MKDVRKELKIWLDRKFNEWQIEVGRKTITEFADFLDIPRPQLSHYMNARNKPESENIEKIAAKLGYEIYDILELKRPDPTINQVIQVYDKVTPEEQEEMIAMIKKWAAERGYPVEVQLKQSDQGNEP